jgi:D-amino peptidase
MVGTEKGILSGDPPSTDPHVWVNNKLVGEIGSRTMLAGYYGVPVIMLSGDTAACKELQDLVPAAECAEVKTGVSRTAGYSLSHPAACALIREKARRAMQRLSEFKPYTITGPIEVKVEIGIGVERVPDYWRREGVERINERTYIFRGKDIVQAWLKWTDF